MTVYKKFFKDIGWFLLIVLLFLLRPLFLVFLIGKPYTPVDFRCTPHKYFCWYPLFIGDDIIWRQWVWRWENGSGSGPESCDSWWEYSLEETPPK